MRPKAPAFVLRCIGICFLPVGARFVPADGHGIRMRRVLRLFIWLTRRGEYRTPGLRLSCLDDFNFRPPAGGTRVSQGANAGSKELTTIRALASFIYLFQ